ncbi:MAG: HAD-IIIA family hydrolase [Ignavibacteria bacterium]|nr:HAD-IIIA family hydrolase [Ignavibacteria bacterium]
MVTKTKNINEKAKKIKLVFTDCDGVLTDTGVYYSDRGEELKRFSLRDGMGVERLREIAKIETGIISGEDIQLLRKRAEKLQIKEVHLGIKNKIKRIRDIATKYNISIKEIAYIGDDINDVDVMREVGISACPADATDFAINAADVICTQKGGHGAFREFAEFIINAKLNN